MTTHIHRLVSLIAGVAGFFRACLPPLILALASTALCAREGEQQTVYLVGSGNASLDQHIENLLTERLSPELTLEPVAREQIGLIPKAPVITIGPTAFSEVMQENPDTPIISLLTEQNFLADFASRSPGQVSGVFYDVPLIRQALTGKAILPQATQIALLATPDSIELYEPLLQQLPAFGLSARIFMVDDRDSLIPTLVRALGYGDFLLAAPDSAIYNPRTIKHILLTAYRRNKIVIGPTQAYVKAGALASSYAPFPEMARLTNEFLNTYFETGRLPPPAYPEDYKVEINRQVGRSLNIPLPSREEIADRVQQRLDDGGETSHE